MLISSSHKFIFVHIYKTGGTSIRVALGGFADTPSRLLKYLLAMWPRNLCSVPKHLDEASRFFPPHVTALELERSLPDAIFHDYYKFAFIRNPWDLQVSLYHYMRQNPSKHPHNEEVSQLSGFDEYVEWRAEKGLVSQYDFLTNPNGDILVDFVGRYELLTNDFRKICSDIGINAALPHDNKSARKRDYRRYYSENSKSIVEQMHAADIQAFGYSF